MTPSPPAITPQSLAHAARRKAARVQEKLKEAKEEINSANTVLTQPVEELEEEEIREAVELNTAAEQKVETATEELEIVKELLVHASGDPSNLKPGKHSGDGIKSLLDKLTGRGEAGPSSAPGPSDSSGAA